jgi:hypothetical protein
MFHNLVIQETDMALASDSFVLVRFSDNDYVTWSSYEQVFIHDDRAQVRGMGAGRRRAFELRHFGDEAFRVNVVELDYDLGVR